MVVVLSAVMRGRPITRRQVLALLISYGGIAFVFASDLRLAGDRSATLTGGALVFGSALAYALYLVDAGAVIARLGSLRFIAWAMLVSCVFVLVHFAVTRDLTLLRVPPSVYALSLAMAVFSTVLPTWLIAEAIHRIGASTSSLIGSLGPVFTIGLGALILGEAIQGIQLLGAALVLVGVMLVTLQPAAKSDRAASAAEVPDA
jgi:drug/metabolite transporter (DMT)-like permease